MAENLFKLACLMFSGVIAFTYLIVSFENRASATSQKVTSAVYTTVSESPVVTKEKKNCSCCEERKEQTRRLMQRRREMVQRARERAQAAQPITNASVTQRVNR